MITIHAPADSIVGFENAPSTDAEKAAVEKAEMLFAELGSVVNLTPSGACSFNVEEAELEVEGSHAEFHVEYMLTCSADRCVSGLCTDV